MTSRLLINAWWCDVPDHGRSVEKGGEGDRFEAFVRGATAGHFAAKGRALPGFDQQRGELRRVEVRPDATGATLAGTHTRGQSLVPAVEDADQFGANRFTRTAEFERKLPDQAAEQEVTGLVLVGERMEEAGDSLLRQPIRIEDRKKPCLDIGPVVFEDRRGESLFAGKIRIERSLWHAGCVGDVL